MIKLVTGDRGFLGSRIKKSLVTAGYIVLGAHRPEIDILNFNLINKLIEDKKPHVIHTAVSRKKDIFRTNYLATINLVEICKKTGSEFTYISSIKTKEEHLCFYGYTKYLAENYIREFSDFKIVSLPTILTSEKIFIDHWLNLAKAGRSIDLYKPYKKLAVIEPQEAVKACLMNIEPKILILDCEVVASCISTLFNIKINVINKYSKSDIGNCISYSDTEKLLIKYFNL